MPSDFVPIVLCTSQISGELRPTLQRQGANSNASCLHPHPAMSLRVLSGANVERICAAFSPVDLQCLMAQVFHAVSNSSAADVGKGASSVQVPHRTTIETNTHNILFMPARLAGHPTASGSDPPLTGQGTSIKIVSVPKKSDPRGLPGTTLVMDEITGSVKAVVNARTLTALRNAAGTTSPFYMS